MDCFKVMTVSLLVHNTIQLEIMPVEPKCSDSYVSSKRNLRCCYSYRSIGEKCYPCNGSFGLECSKPCPEGYYGVKCQQKCDCDRCNPTTGECFYERNSSSTFLRIPGASLAFFMTGAVFFLASFITCLFVRRELSKYKHGKYVLESFSLGETASQNYTRMEENVYHESEQLSINFNDSESTHSSYISQYDRCRLIERSKESKGKPSILSLLRRKDKCSDVNMGRTGYIYVIETQEQITETASGGGQAALPLHFTPAPPAPPLLPPPLPNTQTTTATLHA